MIFLTVGTQLSFDRLVKAVDSWAAAHPETEIFGQIAEPGPDGHQPQHFPSAAYLEPQEHKARFDSAKLVVAHAGMGTIIGALMAGKPLMVMPRRAEFREHRNDHQQATVERLGARAGLLVAADEHAVPGLLDQFTRSGGPAQEQMIAPYADQGLIDALRDMIMR